MHLLEVGRCNQRTGYAVGHFRLRVRVTVPDYSTNSGTVDIVWFGVALQ